MSRHLDTPRQITDTNGNLVWQWDASDPFGNNPPNENPSGQGAFSCNLRFPGQYFDIETGLFQNHQRDGYDPATGRYTQSDPIGLWGGINTYAYALSNTLIYVDPFGLDVDVKTMTDWLTKHAASKSKGQCAKNFRQALDAAGGNSGYPNTNPVFAKDWGPTLTDNGFSKINSDGYTPKVGDTVVFNAVPGHDAGHIESYNGTKWVSDYLQHNFIPPSYVDAPYDVYRAPTPSQDAASSSTSSSQCEKGCK